MGRNKTRECSYRTDLLIPAYAKNARHDHALLIVAKTASAEEITLFSQRLFRCAFPFAGGMNSQVAVSMRCI